MKNIFKTLLAVIMISILSYPAFSQDVTKADPAHTNVLLDTLNVKTYLVTLLPGDKVPVHSHPVYMTYFLTGGKMSQTENGKTTTKEIKPGTRSMHPQQGPHSAENTGTTDLSFIVVEIYPKQK
jgi:beta-alanine degradation protein BauB